MRLKSHRTHSHPHLPDGLSRFSGWYWRLSSRQLLLRLVHIVNSALNGSLWSLDSNDAQSCLRWSFLASENWWHAHWSCLCALPMSWRLHCTVDLVHPCLSDSFSILNLGSDSTRVFKESRCLGLPLWGSSLRTKSLSATSCTNVRTCSRSTHYN